LNDTEFIVSYFNVNEPFRRVCRNGSTDVWKVFAFWMLLSSKES